MEKMFTNCLVRRVPQSCHMTFLLRNHQPELSHMDMPNCKEKMVLFWMAVCPALTGALDHERWGEQNQEGLFR